MIRAIAAGTVFILLFFVYGFYVSQTNLEVIPSGIEQDHPAGFYDYRGISNVQSSLSQGSSLPVEIAAEALKAGLDFLIVTDANQLEFPNPMNSYYEKLLVMTEAEYSFLDSRILRITETGPKTFSSASDFNLHLTDLLSQPADQTSEGLSILAHPFDRGNPTWTGPYPPGLDGIEILNPRSIAGKAWAQSKVDVFWSSLFYFFNSKYAFLRLFREPLEEISVWDSISKDRPFWGFAGANATARAIPWAGYLLRFPSYQRSLELVSNHVILSSELTGSYAKDRSKILRAIKRGQFYISVDILGNPKGFNVTVSDGEKTHLMGSRLTLKPGFKLKAHLGTEPTAFYEIVLLKDGVRESTSNQPELEYEIKEPGVYRVIVRVSPLLPLPDAKKWITWIYSNPFFINSKSGL